MRYPSNFSPLSIDERTAIDGGKYCIPCWNDGILVQGTEKAIAKHIIQEHPFSICKAMVFDLPKGVLSGALSFVSGLLK